MRISGKADGNLRAGVFQTQKNIREIIATLAGFPKKTDGLCLIERRALQIFQELYSGDDPATLGERKLFFKELPKAGGAVSYTQRGSDFLLKKLKELCDKLQITYWLYYGTLLGQSGMAVVSRGMTTSIWGSCGAICIG